MQTLKFASMRGKSDPDRDNVTHGVYYGNNVPGVYTGQAVVAHRTTRGAWVKRETK